MSVPGLEATHAWDTGITLNNQAATPYKFLLTKIGGWRTRPEGEFTADPATGKRGEVPRTGLLRGKTVSYEGSVVARSQDALRQGEDALLNTFADSRFGHRMDVVPYPAAVTNEAYFYYGRCIQFDMDEEVISPRRSRSGGWERPFVLGIRMEDGVFYNAALTTVNDDNTYATFTPVPWSWSAGGATAGNGWNESAVTAVVNNTGLIDAEPILRLKGPVTAPRVINDTINAGLRFTTDAVLLTGEYLWIDFRRRTIIKNTSATDSVNGADWDKYRISDYSDWWDMDMPGLIPGNNTLRYGGKVSTSAIDLQTRFYPPRY